MRVATVLCLSAALAGCGLSPTTVDDLRFRSVRVARLVTIKGLALKHPELGADAVVYEIQFSTHADLGSLQPEVANYKVNDSRCQGDSEKQGEAEKDTASSTLVALPGIYDSARRSIKAPGKGDASKAQAGHENIYYTHFAVRITGFPDGSETGKSPPRLCFALGGGDYVRGRVVTNVVTVPPTIIANAMTRSDAL